MPSESKIKNPSLISTITPEENEDKVKRLANEWTLYATVIEKELCAGFVTSEPTSLMRSVHSAMLQSNPIKAKQFSDHFFKHLD